jgi:hypothetical protein
MKTKYCGATTVEFALVLLIFLMFLLGVVDFSRMLFTWSAANEATRAGARYAVVCDNTGQATAVRAKMQALLPQIQQIDVVWTPPSCDPTNCTGVTVSVRELDFRWISPIPRAVTRTIRMPRFSTFLPREVMRSDPNSGLMC